MSSFLSYCTEFFAGYDLVYLGIVMAIILPALWKDIMCHESFNMTPQEQVKDSLKWTGIWVTLAFILAGITWALKGGEVALQYLVGYGLEKSLAADNMFALMAIASSFGLMVAGREALHYKVLHWGIIGTIILSILFLGTGAFLVGLPYTVINSLHIAISFPFLIFGSFILWSAYGIAKEEFGSNSDDDDDDIDYTDHWSVRVVQKIFPVYPSIESGKFFVRRSVANSRRGKVLFVTPLFLCLVCMEFANIGFSFDSMPVIVSVVDDVTVQLAAVLMATCGLRALYFALAAGKEIFHHLGKSIVVLLVWIGIKIISEAFGVHLLPDGTYGSLMNLAIVVGILSAGIVASYKFPENS